VPSLRRLSRPLRNRQFALLWGGQTVSLLGDGVLSTALPILILFTLHGSGLELGLVAAARLTTLVLLLLFGGALTDRMSKRTAMLLSDAVRGLLVALLGILAVTDSLDLGILIVSMLAFGAVDALFMPASTAMLPQVVDAAELMPANSLTQVSRTLAGSLLGPIIGGVIAASVGASVALFFDAGTFAFSAGCLALMRATPTPARRDTTMAHEVREGLAYCRRTPWLLWTLVAAGVANAVVFSPGVVLLPLLFKEVFGAASWVIGVGFAALGVGGLIGAVIAGAMPTPRRRIRWMWLCWAGAAALDVLFGLSPSAPVACVVLVGIGPLMMMGNIAWESLLQTEVPRDLLGRVSSVDWTLSLAGSPIGLVLAGTIAGVVGIRPTIVVPALIVTVGSLVFLAAFRPLTEIDRRPRAIA